MVITYSEELEFIFYNCMLHMIMSGALFMECTLEYEYTAILFTGYHPMLLNLSEDR